MNGRAKTLVSVLQIIGIGMMVLGLASQNYVAIFFGIAIAIIGGLVGKMQREDDAAGH